MSLAVKAARGAAWTILSSIGGRAIGVLGTLIVTRFLAPDVVGEVGAAMIIVMTANWLTSIGFGQYVIVRGRTEPGPEVVWHANVAVIGLGAIALGAVALLAHPVAWLVNSAVAAFGSTVQLREDNGDSLTYQLVMPEEADAAKGLISTSSPIGRALVGRSAGDEVEGATPSGTRNFEILKLVTIPAEA